MPIHEQHPPTLGPCPVCATELTVSRLGCGNCGTIISGTFRQNRFARLSTEQTRFLESFIRSRGVIKEVEADLGISYPTVRSRLDDVIRQLDLGASETPARATDVRRDILEQLRSREISAAEAHRRLAELPGSDD